MPDVVDSLLLRQAVDGIEDVRRIIRAQSSRLGAIEARFASAEHRWAETETRLDAFSESIMAMGRRFDLVAAIASEARDIAVETRETVRRVETKVEEIDNRLGRVETKVEEIGNRLGGMEARLNGVETRLTTIADSVAELSRGIEALTRALAPSSRDASAKAV